MLTRKSSGWFITLAAPETIYLSGGREILRLTAAQDAIAVAKIRSKYTVGNP